MSTGTNTSDIASFFYAASRHGDPNGMGHFAPWYQGFDCYASDGRILIRALAVHCVGMKIDTGFRLEGVERIFEDWWPADLAWRLPKDVTAGIRPEKVGSVWVMARYIGMLTRYGITEVIPDQRKGGPLGFVSGGVEGLLQVMDVPEPGKIRRRGRKA